MKETVIVNCKFTRNSSITSFKGYEPNGTKIFSKCKSQQFSSSKKTAIFCKILEKIDKNPEMLEWFSVLKIDLILETYQEKVPHHLKISAQESLLGTKEEEPMLDNEAIEKTSAKKGQFSSSLFLIGERMGATDL